MQELLKVLEYLQSNDKNGNYMDIIDEIEGDTLTIIEAKLECIDILNRWLSEDVEATDYITRYQINEIIKTIN